MPTLRTAVVRCRGRRTGALALTTLLVAACSGGSDNGTDTAFESQRIDLWTTTGVDGGVLDVDSLYDSDGRLVGQRLSRDGELVQTRTLAYDADGRLLRREIDDDLDGSAERRRLYRNADDGTLALAFDDNDLDGLIERYVAYLRDDAGTVIGAETRSLDPPRTVDAIVPGDGTLASASSYSIVDGRLSMLSVDEDGDGTADAFSQQNYDAEGRLATAVSTRTDDGTSELTEYRYEPGPCDDTWHHTRFRFYCVF